MEGRCIVRLSIIRLFSAVHRLFGFSPLCIVWLSIIRLFSTVHHLFDFSPLCIIFSTVHRLTVHNKGPASPFPLLSARHLLLLPGTPSREVTSASKVNQGGRMLHAQNYPLDNGCYTSKMGFKSLWKMYMHTNLLFKLRMVALFWSWWQKWMDIFRLKNSKTNIPGAWLSNNLIGSPQLTCDTRSTKNAWTNLG